MTTANVTPTPRAVALACDAAHELLSLANLLQRETAHAQDDELLWLRPIAQRVEALGTIVLALDPSMCNSDECEQMLRGPDWVRRQAHAALLQGDAK